MLGMKKRYVLHLLAFYALCGKWTINFKVFSRDFFDFCSLSHHFYGGHSNSTHSSVGNANRKSRSRERPIVVNNRPSLENALKDRERELERIHRRSRELMLSPRLMDCSGGLSSRDSSSDRKR